MEKSHVVEHLREVIRNKQGGLQAMMKDLQEAAANDTKSSMGDKYETSREMSKQEIQKLGAQLRILQEQESLLERVARRTSSSSVGQGNLVETSTGFFFLGIPLGKIEVDGTGIFCLSLESPMGQALRGTTEGQEVSFRGKVIRILNIL